MTDLASREWRLVREEARPGSLAMALDEIAARTAAEGGPRTLRVYRWEPSALSLGYGQDPATVDWEHCESAGVDVVRRPTGGGGIYHDAHGDVSYTIVAPADELPGDLLESYHVLLAPVLDAFDRLGIDASLVEEAAPALYEPACYLRELNPAHDVVAGGRKLCGNAQYRQRDAVVQHGSITFESRPERHLAAFSDPDAEPAAFAERVTSVRAEAGVDRSTAVSALEAAFEDWADAVEGAWRADELDAARELAAEKYANPAWTRDRDDPTS